MTCGLVSVQGWPLNTGKNNKERQTKDILQSGRGRLIEVAPPNTGNKYSVCMSEKSGL